MQVIHWSRARKFIQDNPKAERALKDWSRVLEFLSGERKELSVMQAKRLATRFKLNLAALLPHSAQEP
jgi:hypothetical protein